MADFDVLVVGCGLSGAVVARELADSGKRVRVLEQRNHVGGNMHDFIDEHGILVHKYGPHTFHTNKKKLVDYIFKYEEWIEYKLYCGAFWDGKYTPTPFNYTTIDTFFDEETAARLKKKIPICFDGRNIVPVTEVLNCSDPEIEQYAQFLFENDYAPYTAKQWGVTADKIDPSVLKRVPLRFSYDEGYFDDDYQLMPKHSYSVFFRNLLSSNNIEVKLGVNALKRISILDGKVFYEGDLLNVPLVYTGAIDELFRLKFGKLPYRSLRFEWFYSELDSYQPFPVVAYPKAAGFTRITEYKKLPHQNVKGTCCAIEFPLPYVNGEKNEPYYPVPTEDSLAVYQKYMFEASLIKNLFILGRLAEFKYYNMDQALENALSMSERIKEIV